MSLLIDIGNSRLKAGLQQAGKIELLPARFWRDEEPDALFDGVLGGLAPQPVLASNVAGEEIGSALARWVRARWKQDVRFARVMPAFAGMRTRYEQPNRLGVDRWLAALAGFQLARGAACVIDSGTAFTADVVNAQGEHLGGLIAPGLSLMARSLTQGTAHLNLDVVQRVDAIATNTRAAISLGCQDAIAGLVAQLARRVAREVPGAMAWFITGGEAAQIAAFVEVPLRVEQDLVLRGLALWGEQNA